jgi:hypothetical protein
MASSRLRHLVADRHGVLIVAVGGGPRLDHTTAWINMTEL